VVVSNPLLIFALRGREEKRRRQKQNQFEDDPSLSSGLYVIGLARLVWSYGSSKPN